MIIKIDYNEAIKKVMEGYGVFILPFGANPHYLAFGGQKINPMAISIKKEQSRMETISQIKNIKKSLENTFYSEKYVDTKKFCYYLVQ